MRRIGTIAALTLLLAAPFAHAAKVTTPPIDVGGADSFFCLIFNGAPKPMEVTIRIIDSLGPAGTYGPMTVQPGRFGTAWTQPPALVRRRFVCVFETNVSRRKATASACVIPGNAATNLNSCQHTVAAQ